MKFIRLESAMDMLDKSQQLPIGYFDKQNITGYNPRLQPELLTFIIQQSLGKDGPDINFQLYIRENKVNTTFKGTFKTLTNTVKLQTIIVFNTPKDETSCY